MHLLYFVTFLTVFRTGEVCSQISNHSEFLQLGRVYFKNGQFDHAEKCLASALQTATRNDRQERASILRTLGDVYVSLDEIPKAERLYTESLEIYRRSGDRLNSVVLMRSLGITYAVARHEPEAVNILKRAKKAASKLPGRVDLVAGLLNDLGMAYYRQGQFKKADQYFAESADMISTAGLSMMNEELLTTRGAVLLVQGRYEKAEECLKQALTLQQLRLGISHPDLSMPLTLLGDLYLRTSRFGQAEDSYRQALRLLDANPQEFNTRIARLLYSLSVTYRVAGQESDADSVLDQAAAIAINNLSKHDMGVIIEEYSANLEKKGNTKQASDLRSAVRHSRTSSDLIIDAFGRF